MSAALQLGSRLGDLTLVEVLGSGSIGTVYGAVSPHGQPVAVKIAHPAADGGGVLQGDWIRREGRLAARLHHPHIVRVLGLGEYGEGADARPFLVLARVDGESLERRADRMSTAEIVRLADQLLGALGYAHDAGVLHLDLSPNNILIRRSDGAALLTDFGLASPRDRREGNERTMVAGTPGYMSPEQALGAGGVGPWSDLYALGAVLHRLVVGFAPHGGADSQEILRRTLQQDALPVRERPGLNLGKDACAVIDALLARGPEDRPVHALEARARWREATRHVDTPAAVEALAPTPAIGLRRGTWVATQAMDLPAATGQPTEPELSVRTAVLATPGRGLSRPSQAPPDDGGRGPLVEELADGLLGGGGVTWLCGARGTGRTYVLDAVRRSLHRRDVAEAHCTGRRATDSPPMEVLAALAVELVGAALGPPWVVAERLALALDAVGAGGLRHGRAALTQGVLGLARRPLIGGARYEVFRAMQQLRPPGRALALLVDDADRMDADSAAVLRDLARGGVGVLLVVESPPDGIDEQDHVVTLPALSAERRQALAGGDEALASSAHVLADLALLGTLHRDLSGDAGSRLADALSRLAAPERDVLAILASLEGEAPARALDELVVDDGTHAEARAALMEVGWIRPVPRPVARSETWVRGAAPCLDARVQADGARITDGAIARWLARRCFDQSLGVWSRVASLASVEAPRLRAFASAEVGRRAAAVQRADAATWMSAALAIGEGVDVGALHVELAQVHSESGESDRAIEHASRGLTQLDERPLLRSRALQTLGRCAAERGDVHGSQLHLRDAVAAIEAMPASDPLELASALASLAWQLGYGMGDATEAIPLMQRALASAERVDAPLFRARLCGRLGAIQLRAGDWDGQLATNLTDLGLSLLGGDVAGVVRAHINLGVCLTNRGALTMARAHTEEACAIARAHGSWAAAHIAENNLATIAVDQGRDDAAAEHVAHANRLAARRGVSPLCETHAVQVRLGLRRGDRAAAEAALAMMQSVARGAERPLCARMASLVEDDAAPVAALLAEGPIADPYDRLTCELVVRGRAGAAVWPDVLEALDALGADPALERRRWLEA